MVVIVDGDNSPGANIKCMSWLVPEDSVYIYFASDNKYFKRINKQETILKTAKCPVTFTSIPAADNAVDFAIAMDLRTIIESCSSEVIVLVSNDSHFSTILNRAKDITQNSGIYQVSDIEEAIKRYKMLESTSLQDLHNLLMKSFGHEMGCDFCRKVDKLFAQKYQLKKAQPFNNDGESKASKKKKRATGEPKSRALSILRGILNTPFSIALQSLTAELAALLKQ